jgi:DNA-binding response OmpR family regulator
MPTDPPVILMVEDDPDLTQMLEDLLSLEGYCVVHVGSTPDAIAYLHQRPPALVQSDLYLSEGTGWEVCQVLCAQHHIHILPFLLMSATPPATIAVADPFLCFIAKLFGPPRLFACVQSLLQHVPCSRAQTRTNTPG